MKVSLRVPDTHLELKLLIGTLLFASLFACVVARVIEIIHFLRRGRLNFLFMSILLLTWIYAAIPFKY